MALKKSNRLKILAQYEAANEGALVVMGRQAVGFVKPLVTVDTGNLRASISFVTSTVASSDKLNEQPEKGHVSIGTNVHYAPHIEFGTVKMSAQPFLRPGILNNVDKLGRTYAKTMKGLTR